ncbi:MAG: hypothetical protein MJ238_04575, partial [Bacilli bacterium]|nr:hypothetical protein [Bacilli bacterium]
MKNVLKATLLGVTALTLCACGNNETPVTPSKWGDEYTETIVGTLGEDLPFLECDSYEVTLLEDDFGDPMVVIYCYMPEDQIQTTLDEYANICAEEGYDVTYDTLAQWDPDGMYYYYYDVFFADKVISETKGIEMQFLEGNNKGKECLGIFAYNYIYVDENIWPSNLINELLGHDIPHLDGEGYKYDAKIYSQGYIDIFISGVEYNADELYEIGRRHKNLP